MYVSYRQTLSLNIEGTFPEFYNYMNGTSDIHTKNKVIIQLDSLNKLGNFSEFTLYDLIIMDEIESLLFHLSSKTLQERTTICDLLDQFIKGAPWIVAMDADFGQRSFDFLSGIKSILFHHISYHTFDSYLLCTPKHRNIECKAFDISMFWPRPFE